MKNLSLIKFIKPTFISLTLLLVIQTGYSQTVANGTLEAWPPSCPYNTAPDDWTNFSTSLGPDQAGDCAGLVASYEGDSHMNLVWSSAGLREGAKQAMSGLIIGDTYNINFYAINDQGLYASAGSVILDFYHNSTVVFSTPELFSEGPWTLYTASFIALTETDTIGFQIAPGSVETSGSVGIDAVSIIETSGVTEILTTTAYSVYPNPTTGIVNFSGTFDVTLTDLTGKVIIEEQDVDVLDIHKLPRGLYFIRLTDENGQLIGVNKIQKE
ncbi:MAG: T9SS type A sorting domain-containing protein [Crocinitomix sp.]|nr:T9SS type A sorting domain-containing protein [Crocinitomix sp.]